MALLRDAAWIPLAEVGPVRRSNSHNSCFRLAGKHFYAFTLSTYPARQTAPSCTRPLRGTGWALLTGRGPLTQPSRGPSLTGRGPLTPNRRVPGAESIDS